MNLSTKHSHHQQHERIWEEFITENSKHAATNTETITLPEGWNFVVNSDRKLAVAWPEAHVQHKVVRIQDAANLAWYFDALKKQREESISVVELSTYINGVNALIGSEQFNILAKMLGDATVRGVNNRILLAIARASFPAKNKIPNWHKFISETAKLLENDGQKSAILLKGMI